MITEKQDEESFNYIRTYEYDSEGRRIKMTFDWHSQDGYNGTSITLYTYGDNTVTESCDDKDADGNIVKKEKRITMDSFGRPVTVESYVDGELVDTYKPGYEPMPELRTE